MSKTLRLQMANTPSGRYDVMEPLPYPFFVDMATGDVGRQDFWKGKPAKVIGFQERPIPGHIHVFLHQVEDPEQLVGMYAVTSDSMGRIASDEWPIMRAEFEEQD